MEYPTLPNNLPPATPQKHLPGAYLQTPAVNRNVFQSPPQQPLQSQQQPQQQQTQASPQVIPKLPLNVVPNQNLTTEQRGARTINETLFQESRYPDLDSYLSRMYFRS